MRFAPYVRRFCTGGLTEGRKSDVDKKKKKKKNAPKQRNNGLYRDAFDLENIRGTARAIAAKLRNDGTPRIMLFRSYDKAGQLIFHNEPLLKGRKSLGRIGRARISACTIMCIHTEPTCFLVSAIVCPRFEEMPNVGSMLNARVRQLVFQRFGVLHTDNW